MCQYIAHFAAISAFLLYAGENSIAHWEEIQRIYTSCPNEIIQMTDKTKRRQAFKNYLVTSLINFTIKDHLAAAEEACDSLLKINKNPAINDFYNAQSMVFTCFDGIPEKGGFEEIIPPIIAILDKEKNPYLRYSIFASIIAGPLSMRKNYADYFAHYPLEFYNVISHISSNSRENENVRYSSIAAMFTLFRSAWLSIVSGDSESTNQYDNFDVNAVPLEKSKLITTLENKFKLWISELEFIIQDAITPKELKKQIIYIAVKIANDKLPLFRDEACRLFYEKYTTAIDNK